MNENYLLHNKTARKLYFEYAKDLPIIALCSQSKVSERIYNNISEAFLSNDPYKLDAMRECGVDEKFITGDASDYEKFKAFCSVLPKFAGHPLYLLCHIELQKYFNCKLSICEDNCDLIWHEVNAQISNDIISEKLLLDQNNIKYHSFLHLSWIEELYLNEEIVDLPTLENALINHIKNADKNGCRIALYDAFSNFIKPNPYVANEIVKRMKAHDLGIEIEDFDFLNMQIIRTLGTEYKKLGWKWLLKGSDVDEDAITYLDNNNALPKTNPYIQFEIGQSEDYLELQLMGYASKHPIGNLICTVNIADNSLSYARNDYFRRTLCNIIGKWVENGEYTSDEKTLKKLIEDILYNNLKEAIS